MNLISLEASASHSEPIEFIKFKVAGLYYYYSLGDYDISVASKLYTRAAIICGAIDGASDPDKGLLSLTVPFSLPITQLIMYSSPSFPVEMWIYRTQRNMATFLYGDGRFNDPLLVTEYTQKWEGRVLSHEITEDKVTVHGVSLISNQYRMGNTLKNQKGCPYAVYDEYNCRVNPATLSTTLPIEEENLTSSSIIQSPGLVWGAFAEGLGMDEALSDLWFTGGFISYQDTIANLPAKRAIIDYRKGEGIVKVFPPMHGFYPGNEIVFTPGCEHHSFACKKKFENILNYGGDPIIPEVDPYDPNTEVF